MTEYIFEVPNYPETIIKDGFNVRVEYEFKQREEIVRCRDCKHCMAYMAGTYCDQMAHSVELDGFCAWGERR